VQLRQRVTGTPAIYKVGRSLACDIVLDDPYVAAEHTAIELLEDGRVAISDLGSRNGTRLRSAQASERLSNETVTRTEADLIVGRTRVRIRTAHTTLAAERLFRRDLLQRHKTPLAACGAAAVLILAVSSEWLQAPENLAPKILIAVVASMAIVVVWIGVWALITRISHGVWNLRLHAAIACNAVALAVASIWLFPIAQFATQWTWLAPVKLCATGGAMLAALFLHLRTSTHLSRRTALIVTALVPLLLGTMAWVQLQSESRDVNRLAIDTPIYPPELRVARGVELDEYLASIDSIKRAANRNRQRSLTENPLVSPVK